MIENEADRQVVVKQGETRLWRIGGNVGNAPKIVGSNPTLSPKKKIRKHLDFAIKSSIIKMLRVL